MEAGNIGYILFKEGFKEGRQEGILEVVEWLERTRKQKVPKSQLKEWGIEEATDD